MFVMCDLALFLLCPGPEIPPSGISFLFLVPLSLISTISDIQEYDGHDSIYWGQQGILVPKTNPNTLGLAEGTTVPLDSVSNDYLDVKVGNSYRAAEERDVGKPKSCHLIPGSHLVSNITRHIGLLWAALAVRA